ncbi:hypothetical protein [Streptomyces scopuliridis]|uniref:hypothetical protein n=1 Tax=Streptomyces scopuliridis TaxID=452529 RepID=UPI0036D01873
MRGAGCGARLTTSLSQVALPAHAHQKYGNGIQLPVLMESATYAVDPEPWGPPWRTWEENGPDEAAARGIYAPVYALSDGAAGGPNMACEACGLPVASRIDDFSLWQAVWLAPNAVRPDKLTDADRRALSPLFWTRVNPYGRFEPDMNSRLDLDLSIRATVLGPRTPQGEAAAAPA